MTPEEILAPLPSRLRSLAQRLRRLVRETVPEASETVYPVWRGLGYRHPRAGYFCGVFPARDRVKLAFEFGVLLSDPEGLLREGPTSARKVRYVEVRTASDLRRRAIRALLRQAVRLKADARPARRATGRASRGRQRSGRLAG